MDRLVSGHHPSLLWMGGRLVLSLMVVLALFLGAVWVVRQLQRKTRTIRAASREEIRILQTVVVAPKSTVSVVKVGEESFLLGVTPQTGDPCQHPDIQKDGVGFDGKQVHPTTPGNSRNKFAV